MTTNQPTSSPPPLFWDVFCRVVDNFGDIGVCWRLAVNLAARGQQVRLWVDEPAALHWMAPGALEGQFSGIRVLHWAQSRQAEVLEQEPLADVWVETFGCEIAPEFIAYYAYSMRSGGQNGTQKWPVWINLEYLTAEGFAERAHTLPSPIMSGPAAGCTKHFFYPGFTPGTGGLLREVDLLFRQTVFNRDAWLSALGIGWRGERVVSLFCYEPPALGNWLHQMGQDAVPTHLLVTHGRTTEAVKKAVFTLENEPQTSWNMRRQLSISYLPTLTQRDFDHLLWACDLNFVRGEDSLVRAIWAGRPFVWQIYPQHDNAHHDKLAAFLDVIEAPASLRRFHRTWNEVDSQPLQAPDLTSWSEAALRTRQRLLAQPDLVSHLLEFVARVRR